MEMPSEILGLPHRLLNYITSFLTKLFGMKKQRQSVRYQLVKDDKKTEFGYLALNSKE